MAGVQADSVTVLIEAKIAQYERDMKRAGDIAERELARIRRATAKPVNIGAGGSNSVQATERNAERVARAKRREVESEEAAAGRIAVAVQKGVDARNRQASEAERASTRIQKAQDAGSRSLVSSQTRLMSGTSLSGVQSNPVGAINEQIKAQDRLAFGVGRVANGYRNLGRQIADVGTSVAGGINPFLILAQQAPQVADALADTGGKAAGVARFFAGPWGAALLAAGSVAAIFAADLLKTGESVEDLVAKLRKQRTENDSGARAQDIFSRSVDGVTEAIDKQNQALRSSLQTQEQARQRALALALAQYQIAQSAREATKAKLDEAIVDARIARDAAQVGAGADESGAGANEARKASRRLADLQEQARNADLAIEKARQGIRTAQISISNNRVEEQLDPVKKATGEYERQLGAIQRLREAGKLTRTEYERQALALGRVRDATVQAAQAAENARKADTRAGPLTQFVRPTDGRVTSGFGARARPTAGASTNHQGVDYAGAIGAPVRAAAGGVVISAGKLGGFGNAIIIDHGGGTITQYSHLSALAARKGDTVAAGQNIGAIGATGVATGPHLDFRVKQNGRYVDPTKGRYRTDETAFAQRAETIARQQDAVADRELRNQESFVNEYERLSQQILDLQGQRALTAQEAADIDRANIESEFRRRKSAIATDANAADTPAAREREIILNGLNEYRRTLLLRNAALKEDTDSLNEIKDQNLAILDTQQNEYNVALALAETNEERRKIELQIIDNKYKQLQIELENTRAIAASAGDAKKVAEANRELAKLPGQRAVDERGANRNNEGRYERYRREMSSAQSLQDDIDGIKIQTLEAVTDELTNATKAALGLKGAFGDIVGELIRIGIQRKLIGPLADALFGAAPEGGGASSSSGGGGGLLGGFIKSFSTILSSGGPRASGGNVSAGQLYKVNELGIEGFQPAQSGKIIPLGRMKAGPTGNTTIVQQSFVLDARYGITTPQLIDYVNRKARSEAVQAGKASYQASPARSQQLDQLGT